MSTPSPASSTIQVFVRWKEQTVFAGEDIECQITFKNVALPPTPRAPHPSASSSFSPAARKLAQVKNGSPLNPHPSHQGKGHRSTLSLNVPAAPLRVPPASTSWSARNAATKSPGDGGQHKRSVSIISIGTTESVPEDAASQQGTLAERPRGISRGHGRSASLQIVPRGLGINGAPIPSPSQRSTTQPSPLFSFPSNTSEHDHAQRPSRRQSGVATAPSTPGTSNAPFIRRKGSGSIPQTFKFPAVSPPNQETSGTAYFGGSDGLQDPHDRLLSPRSKESIHAVLPKAIQTTKVLSPASATGTPRSSGEFYSLSNNSTETLASEYIPQPTVRLSHGGHIRRSSNMPPINHHRPPETLMMGYAQINGSFTLDPSLISQTPFDEVKRKGAVGGQGGGVIGLETSKRESGLLKSFGWSTFGESLGGLLGGGELSSMKDMRGIASSRSIPLLSTPQSILFVDLRLAPGESRIYEYSFKLPRGLPPSHRGKAIKITYKLVIGTQRPGGSKEQQVRSVDFPFRVLGSVNNYGELLGHDLMCPYIILRDQARVKTIESNTHWFVESSQELKTKKVGDSSSDDFLSYVDELLSRPRQNSSLGLLSPTEEPRSRRQSIIEQPSTAKEAIDMAILRSNVATEMQQSANRFEIARSGKRVAVIMLARPAYRLGETINAAIDFTDAEIPCYAVHMTLETSEKVDSSIALRSEASILRVTRKMHVSHSESTLFTRRVVFSPTVPISATPEFLTTGVSLEWRIRIEFVTPSLFSEEIELLANRTDLLEEISRDDRGAVFASAETLQCESFEIAVPLRVYGAAGNTETDEGLLDGLVV